MTTRATKWRMSDCSLFKIVILGDSSVGKTSLLKRFVNNKFSNNHKTTLGADFMLHEIEIDGRAIRLQLWDTAGQERFDSLGSALYRGADACILTYDVCSPVTFKNLDHWRDEFLLRTNQDDIDRFPFVVVGNKVDLENRAITTIRAEKWCKERGSLVYMETSAKENLNVSRLFLKAATMALEKETVIDSQYHFDNVQTIDLTKKAKVRTGEQCGCWRWSRLLIMLDYLRACVNVVVDFCNQNTPTIFKLIVNLIKQD